MAGTKVWLVGGNETTRGQLRDLLVEAEHEVQEYPEVTELPREIPPEVQAILLLIAEGPEERERALAEVEALQGRRTGRPILVGGPDLPVGAVMPLLRAGVADYIVLPVPKEELAATIQRVIQQGEQAEVTPQEVRLQEMLANLYALHTEGQREGRPPTADRIADVVAGQAVDLVPAQAVLVALAENGMLRGKGGCYLKPYEVLEYQHPVGNDPISQAFLQQQTLVLEGRQEVSALGPWVAEHEEWIRALILPLIFGQVSIGVLCFLREEAQGPFTVAEQELLEHYTQQAAMALESARLNEQLQRLLMTDSLTGLYNFRYFQERLEAEIGRARRYKHPLSLLIADIDWFRQYNERNGRQAGDVVLVRLGQIMREEIREIDLLARIGHEEFGILMPETHLEGALRVAQRINSRVANHLFPYATSQPLGYLTVSIGVCCYPDDARDANTLLEGAYTALRQAKDQGRNQVCAFVQEEARMVGEVEEVEGGKQENGKEQKGD